MSNPLLRTTARMLVCVSSTLFGVNAFADPIDGPTVCLDGGQIVALVGPASASGPGGSRGVGCGDTLCAGDTLSTGAGGSAGILVGSVLTQLGSDSRAQIGVTPQLTPAVGLEQGGVRMLDPRESGAPGLLRVRDHQAEISGNDAEAYLLEDSSGPYARFCERGAPLRVRSGSDDGIVEPGSCATARSPLAAGGSAGSSPGIPALSGSCEPSPSIPLAAHVPLLPPVASPPGNGPPLPEPPTGPRRSSCDVPGAACGLTTRVVEPPPSTDPFPGGGSRR